MPDGLVTLRISPQTGRCVSAENADGMLETFMAESPALQRQACRRASRRPATPAAPASESLLLMPPTQGDAAMPRRNSAPQLSNLRRALAQEAARIMAEHGIQDFLRRQAQGRRAPRRHRRAAVLPKNTEIEVALAEYQRLFGGDAHVEHSAARSAARRSRAMRASASSSRGWSARCSPAPPPSTPTCSCTCSPTAPRR